MTKLEEFESNVALYLSLLEQVVSSIPHTHDLIESQPQFIFTMIIMKE